MATLFLDDLIGRARGMPADRVSRAGAALLFVVMAIESAGLVLNAPEALSGPSTQLTRNSQFVQKFARPGQPLLFLTLDSGIYSLAARALSPVAVPGTVELILRRDFETLERYLSTSSPIVIFDRTWSGPTALLVNALQGSYRVIDVSPDGDLVVLSR